jgi:PleD family two-component response regulator
LIKVTISIGSTVSIMDDTVDSLVGRADKLMYDAKLSGRNCVVMD